MPSPDLFPQFVAQLPDNWQDKALSVGLSGGMDSVVLLHLLCRTRVAQNWQLTAVHVHHGLNSQADDWLIFCQKLCTDWQVDFVAQKVQVHSADLGLEAAARQARYAVFAQQQTDVLALAHHLNDQLETYFLAALRGGGIRALSAMPVQREWLPHSFRLPENTFPSLSGSLESTHNPIIWRPLLSFSREAIAHYAQQYDLKWVEDSSNADTQYLRNWLRHDVLPHIQQRLPQLAAHISGSIAQLQDDLAILNEVLREDEARISDEYGRLHITQWQALSSVRRRQQLLRFAQKHDLGTPTRHSIVDFERIVLKAKTAEWALPKGKAVLYQGMLFAWQNHLAERCLWCRQTFSGSLMELAADLNMTLGDALPESTRNSIFHVRVARRDDVFVWADGHRKQVFRFLREQGIPPFMRAYWAVVCDDTGQCVGVVNLWGNLLYSQALRTFQAA
ncbi:MAG: tRNA lysidine(34) synthetase TilS [Alysiella sp.]|uniref:tRNA lysidine(34) synthetase TilS n=1 Tax=Alysiella sp. TaxID=1872483 RepID=UPI0026DD6ABA|nr:tRNA lysidine(34) synthetase TilS [Alysiella sp.]MDO4434365.1 tRNA lysidine(34) synthetase TilS [Alysiella sp.]